MLLLKHLDVCIGYVSSSKEDDTRGSNPFSSYESYFIPSFHQYCVGHGMTTKRKQPKNQHPIPAKQAVVNDRTMCTMLLSLLLFFFFFFFVRLRRYNNMCILNVIRFPVETKKRLILVMKRKNHCRTKYTPKMP